MLLSSRDGGCNFLRVAAVLVLGAAVSACGFAQPEMKPSIAGTGPAASADSPSGARKLTFDAASVRPGQRGLLKGGEFLDPVNRAAPPRGGLYSWNVPLAYLIYFAYDIRSSPLKRGVWEQLQKAGVDPFYAIEARADGEPSREDVRAMVRSLLEDRFKLVAHAGTRDGQVNALAVVKPPAALKPHAAGGSCELTLPRTDSAYPPYKDFPVRCGIFDRELGRYKRRIEMVDVTPQQIAETVGNHSMLPVIDATGLEGHLDGYLDYGPDMLPADADSSLEAGLPIAAALEQQFGMKLVKRNAKVDYFVIEHVQKPSEN